MMNVTKPSILLILCLHMAAGVCAADLSTPVGLQGSSCAQWATAQQPAMQMSSSSAYLTSCQSVAQSAFRSTMGAQPARSIMLDNLNNAFAGDEPGGPSFAPRRGRDEPSGPSDPPGMDTPAGNVPWLMLLLLLTAYGYYLHKKSAQLKK